MLSQDYGSETNGTRRAGRSTILSRVVPLKDTIGTPNFIIIIAIDGVIDIIRIYIVVMNSSNHTNR